MISGWVTLLGRRRDLVRDTRDILSRFASGHLRVRLATDVVRIFDGEEFGAIPVQEDSGLKSGTVLVDQWVGTKEDRPW